MFKNYLTNAKHIVEFTSTLKAQRYIKNWNEFTLLYLGKKEPLNIILKDGTTLFVRPSDQRTIHEIALRDDYKIRDMALDGNVIDISANVGVFSVLAAKKSARVFAYEPVESNFNILLRNIRQNDLKDKISAFRMLISDKKGKEEICIDESNPGCHSIYGAGNRFELDCISLEDVFLSNDISTCKLLKMDVEGAEYQILQGTPQHIFDKIKKIHLEYHNIGNKDGAFLKHLLEKRGFKVDIEASRFTNHGYQT
jgi:FkbM family methyltransferase